MKELFVWLPVCLVLLGWGVEGAKVLVLLPFPFFSHTNAFMPVFKELNNRGHHITMLSPFPQAKPRPNWTDLVVKQDIFDEHFDRTIHIFSSIGYYKFFFEFWPFLIESIEIVYKDEAVKKLISEDKLDYDVIITEPFFAHESLLALAYKANTPVVGIHPLSLSPWPSYFTGNDLLSSHIPNYRTPYTHHMSFFQRLDNTFLMLIEMISGLYYYLPMQEKLMKENFFADAVDHPSLSSILRNVSLLLIDSHHSIGYPQPHQPNIIPVGGLSAMSNTTLPGDLQRYMDNAPNGVVYLSFGSHLKVSAQGDALIQAILAAFSEIDAKVLMKWENETLPNQPSNIEIRKWFPQSSILAHPNCRAFVTHGGLHGISEAAYHGVPVVGIPFYSDQLFNLRFAEHAGFGITVLKDDISTKSFLDGLQKVLTNDSYKKNAERMSKITRDRQSSSLDTAVFWIEYAIRHRDLSHLRPAASHLTLFQLYLVDVFAFIFVLIFLFSVLISVCLKKVCRSSSKTKSKNVSKKKKA